MGELFTGTGARVVGDALSDMFSQTNITSTKARVVALRANGFPGLLHRRVNAAGAPARQLTLRFAAWLLTAHLPYHASDPSRGNFRDWLRWLSYLRKEHPKVHNRIRNRIEDNLSLSPPKPMVFRWTPILIEQVEVDITEPTMAADFIRIEVFAKDGPNVPANDEDDSDNAPVEP